ncbi:hypothetical protein DL239_18660 [Sedimentitalea sp. CY04]|uniref:Uncharacterized protein n=1 Tax=Parasedimentitalea denitrificans TaxID=2211118 RepID=A0ABX0WC00_9RHOB|nr:hypothetical protein [Sedimentitalea sp. CY04]NIZ62991.1 hypothetical protein [Sedimentitalea sp. CY04]
MLDMKQHKDSWAVADEFLEVFYGAEATDVWVTGFNDITTDASWFGMQGTAALRRRVSDPDNADLYFCTGQLRRGANNRTLGEVVAQPMLYADDIGTKVDRKLWDEMFAAGFPQPTAKIETSPGNETWVWKLEGDATTPERWQELALLRAYMIERKLTDALHDATRYLRLPWGHNSKPAYKDSKNRSPAVGYIEWNPTNTATVDAIGLALIGNADWRNADVPMSAKTSKDLAAMGAGARPRDASMDDAVVRMAEVVGLEPRERTQGVVDAMCPNWHAHGDRPETGFSFIGSDGSAFCNHASCDALTTPDFVAMVRTQYEDHVSGLIAMGLNTENLPESSSIFEARIWFGAYPLTPAEMKTNASRQAKAETMAAKQPKRGDAAHERAAETVLSGDARLFQDEKGTVWLSREGRLFNISGKDRGLLRVAAKNGHNLTGTAANNLFDHLLNRVDGDAPKEVVHFRQAQLKDEAGQPAIYVNRMANGRVVKIQAFGWEELPVSKVSIHMTDRKGGLPLPEADTSAAPADLFPLLGRHLPIVSMKDPNSASDPGVRQRAALLSFLGSALYRPGTVPHMMIAGQQGSGKTTMARRLVALTDPDAAAVTSTLPSEPEKLFPVVSNRLNMVVDNASRITKSTSDVLCALASGTSYAARKLYTDGDRSITQAHASVVFTSVLSGIVNYPDLAQRTLRIEPPNIARTQRRSESALDEAWKTDYPKILGALYSAMAGGLTNWDAVETDCERGVMDPPRLSDAAITAEAMAQGLGWPAGLCMTALSDGEQSEAGRILENNPVALRLKAVLEAQPGGIWCGSFAELEMAVANIPLPNGPPWDRKLMPFKGQYERLWPGLEEVWGIKRKRFVANRSRQVRLIQVSTAAAGAVSPLSSCHS